MVRSIDIFYIMMVIQYYQGSLGGRSRGSHQSNIYIMMVIQYYQGSIGGDHKVFTGIKGE